MRAPLVVRLSSSGTVVVVPLSTVMFSSTTSTSLSSTCTVTVALLQSGGEARCTRCR